MLTDASKRKESVEQVIKLGKTIRKYGGTFAVIQPNSLKRDGYNFKEYRANMARAAWQCSRAGGERHHRHRQQSADPSQWTGSDRRRSDFYRIVGRPYRPCL